MVKNRKRSCQPERMKDKSVNAPKIESCLTGVYHQNKRPGRDGNRFFDGIFLGENNSAGPIRNRQTGSVFNQARSSSSIGTPSAGHWLSSSSSEYSMRGATGVIMIFPSVASMLISWSTLRFPFSAIFFGMRIPRELPHFFTIKFIMKPSFE